MMSTPQAGIFALGTASHAYLEFDSTAGDGAALGRAVAALEEPRTTIGGVNLVAGFRPELWRMVAPDDTPATVTGFNQPLVGPDGYTMPATQHDVMLWVSGSAYDVVFDVCRSAIKALAPVAALADEETSWPYRHDRDLTGFIDGTENPSLSEAPGWAVVADGKPGAGGCVLLVQRWGHDSHAWEQLPVAEQERAMGRRKSDSLELEERDPESHVVHTDQEEFGKIFRRNMPYGSVRDHGTMFVGFSNEQSRLVRMLERMTGIGGGPRDALTRYMRPTTGAYYFVPSTQSLGRLADLEDPTAS